VTDTENLDLCTHVQFSRGSRSYPGTEADWQAYLSHGGRGTLTRLLAAEHAGECPACAKIAESEGGVL
jgi:hypothetical protein